MKYLLTKAVFDVNGDMMVKGSPVEVTHLSVDKKTCTIKGRTSKLKLTEMYGVANTSLEGFDANRRN
jgi:hypothetical protein